MTLTEFLLARIAEDEATALKARRTWSTTVRGTPRGSAPHVTRWDPYYVLAECKAKRRIVEGYKDYEAQKHEDGQKTARVLHTVLRFLAEPYSDRADYQPEWRP